MCLEKNNKGPWGSGTPFAVVISLICRDESEVGRLGLALTATGCGEAGKKRLLVFKK